MIILLIIAVVILMWQNLTMTFKISYYEQTLENHRNKFNEERYKHIEHVKGKCHPL